MHISGTNAKAWRALPWFSVTYRSCSCGDRKFQSSSTCCMRVGDAGRKMGGREVARDDDQLAVARAVLVGGEFHGAIVIRFASPAADLDCQRAVHAGSCCAPSPWRCGAAPGRAVAVGPGLVRPPGPGDAGCAAASAQRAAGGADASASAGASAGADADADAARRSAGAAGAMPARGPAPKSGAASAVAPAAAMAPAREAAAVPAAPDAPIAGPGHACAPSGVDVPVYPTRMPPAGRWRYRLQRGLLVGQRRAGLGATGGCALCAATAGLGRRRVDARLAQPGPARRGRHRAGALCACAAVAATRTPRTSSARPARSRSPGRRTSCRCCPARRTA